jgi:hypothetical protein
MSTSSPSRPSAARQRRAVKRGETSTAGTPARCPSTSRSTNARNSPAISTMVSTEGQLSHTRSSSVGAATAGRTSKYTIPASVIAPLATSSATSLSYSAAEDTGAASPVVGQRCHTKVRTLE